MAKRAAAVAKVQQGARLLADVSEELKADREVVLAALRQNARALDFAALELKATERLCRQPWGRMVMHWILLQWS